jgi:hypothetical protein
MDIYGPFHATHLDDMKKTQCDLAAFAYSTDRWNPADPTTGYQERWMVWFVATKRKGRDPGVFKRGDMVLGGAVAFKVKENAGVRSFEEVAKNMSQNLFTKDTKRQAVAEVDSYLTATMGMQRIPTMAELVLNRVNRGELDEHLLPVR